MNMQIGGKGWSTNVLTFLALKIFEKATREEAIRLAKKKEVEYRT